MSASAVSKPSGSQGSSRSIAADDPEHRAAVLRTRQVYAYSTVVWAGSLPLDVIAARWVSPQPLGYFVALRAVGSLAIGLCAAWLYRDARPTPRALAAVDVALHTVICALVGLMAVRYLGFASPYAHGISCILIARGITLAVPWRRGLAAVGIPALAYPLTLLVASAFDAGLAAQRSDPAAMGAFAQHVFWIAAVFALLTAGSHAVWSLRREVAAARNVGRYKLKQRIGAGATGEVWRAYHQGLKRDVAVKVLRPAISQGTALARFEREVRATTELTHPNTVRIFDYGVTDDGLWYYVMELLAGETLAQLVRRAGPLEAKRAAHAGQQAARALAEAHARGIVHRDVKPENLFVTRVAGDDDFVKVLDFGVARFVEADGSTSRADDASLTQDGALLGTPWYMSPEQALGEPVDARTDVYALGASLYYALTGAPPFEGDTNTQVMLARVQREPDAPSERLGAPVPAALEAVVMKCLKRDPAARYATARELAAALRAFEAGAREAG